MSFNNSVIDHNSISLVAELTRVLLETDEQVRQKSCKEKKLFQQCQHEIELTQRALGQTNQEFLHQIALHEHLQEQSKTSLVLAHQILNQKNELMDGSNGVN